MTELFLVRHGQADSAGENYDQLTPTGLAQAEKLGQWLAAQNYVFTDFVHGGLKRQLQTLEAIRGQLFPAQQELPAMEIHSAFAEFDLRVWGLVAAHLRHGHAGFGDLLKRWNKARRTNAANKGDIFKQLTGIILKYWTERGEDFQEAESFPAFRRRVLSALDIHRQGEAADNRRYLAVTSGGPISLITGEVLGLDLTHTLALMRRVYNTSLHHYVRHDNEWHLVTFNSLPHLAPGERTLV